MDIYFPANTKGDIPALIFIHGGAWLSNDKYAEAISFIYENAEKYGIDKEKIATYVDKNDPPFLIIHGEKDELVNLKQSQLLSSWLNVYDVPNELIVVEGAPHFGPMFDADYIRKKVIEFLKEYLN